MLARLAQLVRARSATLQSTIFDRSHAVERHAPAIDDLEYLAGLRASIAATVEQAIDGISQDQDSVGPVPSETLAQARRAARGGVGLDTVLVRHTAGHGVLAEAILDEAEAAGVHSSAQRVALRTGQALLERALEAVASEYRREADRLERSDEHRRSLVVRRLLAGAAVDTRGLGYRPAAWHLGIIATGPGAGEAVRRLGCLLNRDVLADRRSEDSLWAWFGGERSLSGVEIDRLWPVKGGGEVALAVGEPAQGITGFGQTHRQAQAALQVALRSPQQITLFRDVALVAAVLRDELMARSLEHLYLEPLRGSRDDGARLRDTLRAYFACGCSASSAASALGVNRHTVEGRVRTVEMRLGRPLPTWRTEMEVALRVEQLNAIP
jgi:hypothetical protein